MRMCSGGKCSDLVLLCPNQRHTLRLYRDAKSVLADEVGVHDGMNAVEVSNRIAICMGGLLDWNGSGRPVARRLIVTCALAVLVVSDGAAALASGVRCGPVFYTALALR